MITNTNWYVALKDNNTYGALGVARTIIIYENMSSFFFGGGVGVEITARDHFCKFLVLFFF